MIADTDLQHDHPRDGLDEEVGREQRLVRIAPLVVALLPMRPARLLAHARSPDPARRTFPRDMA